MRMRVSDHEQDPDPDPEQAQTEAQETAETEPAPREGDRAPFDPRNFWFSHTLSYGRFVWLDSLISPSCTDTGEYSCARLEVPAVTLTWSVTVVVTTSTIAALETADRWQRFEQCRAAAEAAAATNATNAPCVSLSPWFFDFGHWTFMWFLLFHVCRIALIVQHRTTSRVARRADRGPPSLLARVAWFAHVNGVPGTIVAGILYAIYTRDGELHGPLTDASYVLNAAFAVLDVWFFRMVLLYAHVVWVVATAAVYAAIMMWRSYHRPDEVVLACALLGVVYTAIADFSMMRDTFYRNHAFV